MSVHTASLWSASVGHVNVATYAPNEPADAFPGSPVFPQNWVNVYWYPGIVERLTVHTTEKSAMEEYAATETLERWNRHLGNRTDVELQFTNAYERMATSHLSPA